MRYLLAGLSALSILLVSLVGPGQTPSALASTHAPVKRVVRHGDRPLRTKHPAELSVTPHFLGGSPKRGRAAIRPNDEALFSICPAIGGDTGCGVVIQITAAGASVLTDGSQPPFDGSDDTLVGVVNDSEATVQSIGLGSNEPIFAFDGDGICSGAYGSWDGSADCPYGPTGYEGPGTSFFNYQNNNDVGDVGFSSDQNDGLAPDDSTYFSLESVLSSATLRQSLDYAALGDSYATGNGTYNSNLSDSCLRSTLGWPWYLATTVLPQLSITPASFLACSGASIQAITSSQIPGLQALPSQEIFPDVVTVTAGGDNADVGFGNMLRQCYKFFSASEPNPSCVNTMNNVRTFVMSSAFVT